MSILGRIAQEIQDTASEKHDAHPFWYFEPWDIEERPEWLNQYAIEDGVNLKDREMVELFGDEPRLFQSGFFQSTKKLRFILAGSQVGKSICPRMEATIMISGALPYAFRYERGVDTGIKREISNENILRFGRRDSSTGKIIDYRLNSPRSQTWNEWDCGNIIGAGLYPQEKIAPPGSQIWIGTLAESIKKYWWPMLADPIKRQIPEEFIDTSRGNKGFNSSLNIIHCIRGITIYLMSYEQGHIKFESERCWLYIGDEETPNQELFASAQEHSEYTSLSMTALKGITWSRDFLFNKEIDVDRFHATQFDSPYQKRKDIERRRKGYPIWIRQARIWGIYSEQSGEPYFDRAKINIWIQRHRHEPEPVVFRPKEEWFKMKGDPSISSLPGLLDVDVGRAKTNKDNRDHWLMYEDVKEGIGYVLAADPAEGAETAGEAGDTSAAMIMRLPLEHEDHPVIVCTYRTTLPTKAFARNCAYAMRHYNNSLLASETGIGADNKAFEIELDDWPYWYKTVTTRDSTGLPRQRRGFVMKTSQRDAIFKEVEDYLNQFDADEYPHIPDYELLKELAAAIRGKKGRCDHPRRGSLDSGICFGILLYILKNEYGQIKCNTRLKPKKRMDKSNIVVPYGLSMMGLKEQQYETSRRTYGAIRVRPGMHPSAL